MTSQPLSSQQPAPRIKRSKAERSDGAGMMSKECSVGQRIEQRAQLYTNLETLERNKSHIREADQPARDLLDKQEKVFQEIAHCREGALDAVFLSRFASTSRAGAQAQSLNAYDPGKFVRMLRSRFSVGTSALASSALQPQPSTSVLNASPSGILGASDSEHDDEPPSMQSADEDTRRDSSIVMDWTAIGQIAVQHFLRVAAPSFMNGPVTLKRKPRAATDRKRKVIEAKEENVDENPQGNPELTQNLTAERMAKVYTLVKKLAETPKTQSLWPPNRVPMMLACVNPDSFCNTSELLFYLSFLIKDGQIGVEVLDGIPYLYVPDRQVNAESISQADRKQWMYTLSHAKFLKLAEYTRQLREQLQHQQPSASGGSSSRPQQSQQQQQQQPQQQDVCEEPASKKRRPSE